MMVIITALTGLLVGWLVNQAAGYLTARFAVDPNRRESTAPAFSPPTIWQLIVSPRASGRPGFGLHLAVELLSAAVFAYLWGRFGLSWNVLLAEGSFAFLLLVAVIDLEYRLVLNALTYPAIAAVTAAQLIVRQRMLDVFLGAALAFGIFFLTAWLRPGDLGWGDVKLAALIGLAFGFPQVLWALILGAGLAACLVVYLICVRHKGLKARIPYAPFLCFGAMAALLYNPLATL